MIGKAASHFEDLVKSVDPTKDVERWSLYMGLKELADGLQNELGELRKRLDRLERG
jgi:hypothetical protein